jgi:hypothetical protein
MSANKEEILSTSKSSYKVPEMSYFANDKMVYKSYKVKARSGGDVIHLILKVVVGKL